MPRRKNSICRNWHRSPATMFRRPAGYPALGGPACMVFWGSTKYPFSIEDGLWIEDWRFKKCLWLTIFDYSIFNLDGLVKSMFSRKDTKNANKISFNINKLTLRALRLCARFWLFASSSIRNRQFSMSFPFRFVWSRCKKIGLSAILLDSVHFFWTDLFSIYPLHFALSPLICRNYWIIINIPLIYLYGMPFAIWISSRLRNWGIEGLRNFRNWGICAACRIQCMPFTVLIGGCECPNLSLEKTKLELGNEKEKTNINFRHFSSL